MNTSLFLFIKNGFFLLVFWLVWCSFRVVASILRGISSSASHLLLFVTLFSMYLVLNFLHHLYPYLQLTFCAMFLLRWSLISLFICFSLDFIMSIRFWSLNKCVIHKFRMYGCTSSWWIASQDRSKCCSIIHSSFSIIWQLVFCLWAVFTWQI